ncbi:MAG: hypothetical protein ACTSXL_03135 [Alphaproteobacteria bacterium]
MNKYIIPFLKHLIPFRSWWHRKFFAYNDFWNSEKKLPILSMEESMKLVSKKIKSGESFMLGRYGFTELRNLFCARKSKQKRLFKQLVTNAGFFPLDIKLLSQFRKVYEIAEKNLDILLPWSYFTDYQNRERRRVKNLPNIKNLCSFAISGSALGYSKNADKKNLKTWANFEYFMKNSWFQSLKDKKVLVIHPFEKSIKSQYKKLSQRGLMPKFKKLSFIKAVQSVGLGGDDRFKDWFEALDYMKKQIKRHDFDVAIIGCGAYGFPLASYVKSLGKQGLHTGGATQLLFAIKGQRWEEAQGKTFIEDFWIYPAKSERPKAFKQVESGCYW